MKSARVYIKGIPAGRLIQESPNNYRFTYDEAYVLRHREDPVCLAMPVREKSYSAPYLFPFFSNMLSEGSNRKFQARLHHIDLDDDFSLLLDIAGCDTIGEVTVKPE